MVGMRWMSIVLVAALGGCAAQATLAGRTVPPYPDGLKERSGMCLSETKDCRYSLSVLDSDRGGPAVAAALEVTSRNARGPTGWRVLDSRELPRVRDGYSIEMGSCRLDSRKDDAIMAIVKSGTGKYRGDAYWAVRFDRKQKRFVSIPAARVDCESGDPNCS